jgi:hypothetical protein
MNRISSVLLKCIFVAAPAVSLAQKVTMKESEASEKDYLHEFVVIAPDKYLAINYAGSHGMFSAKREEREVEVAAYDKNLNRLYSNPIQAIDGQKYEAGLKQGNQFYLFVSDKKNKLFKFKLNSNDGTATQEGELFEIKAKDYSFQSGYSKDSSLTYIACISETGKKERVYDGVVMNKQMKVVTKFSIPLEFEKGSSEGVQFVLADDGILYMIVTNKVKKPETYRPHAYTVIKIDEKGQATTTEITKMPEGSMVDFIWQAGKGPLSFIGTMSGNAKMGISAIVSGAIDLQQKELVISKTVPFTQYKLFGQANDESVNKIAKTGLASDCHIKAIFHQQDNNIVLAIQQYTVTVTERYSGSGAVRSYVDTWTGDIYVLKLDAGLQEQWSQKISCTQGESGISSYVGFLAVKDNKEGIHFLFHDHPKNANVDAGKTVGIVGMGININGTSLADVYITNNGKATKKFIHDNTDVKLCLSPKGAVTQNNMMIYTAIDKRNAGKSSYAMGKLIAE